MTIDTKKLRELAEAAQRIDGNIGMRPATVIALLDEIDEARRIGLSMCRLAHNLTTTAGSGEYAAIEEARARLSGVEDVRDLATLLADSESRARNAERAGDAAREQLAAMTKARDEACERWEGYALRYGNPDQVELHDLPRIAELRKVGQ